MPDPHSPHDRGIVYIALFKQGVGWFPSGRALAITLGFGGAMYAFLYSGLNPVLKIAVAAYVVVIALMAAQAIGRATVLRDKRAVAVAVGAGFFMLSDSMLATMPKFKTASGRTVYGGGGIYPDVIIKELPNLTKPQVDQIQKRVFWEFATKYLNHRKDQKWTPQSFSPAFKLTEADWADLRKIMELRKAEANDSLMTADRDFMTRQVRMELANEAFGPLERYKVFAEQDTQLAHRQPAEVEGRSESKRGKHGSAP